jgi:UDP-glucose 4-epimerase
MRILVTGGAGFIGSHLIDRLVRDRAGSVVVLDNLARGRLKNLELSRDAVEFIEGDIRDREAVRNAIRGADLVYHLAAQSSVMGAVTDLEYSFSTNVVGTFNLLQAACDNGVKRLVFTSSREVYGDPASLPVPETAALNPKNSYGASKAAAEFYCRVFRDCGLETSILRLTNVYGARDFGRVIPIFIEKAAQGQPLTLYGGNQVVDFVWIDTVTEALMAAGSGIATNGPMNVGSGQGTSLVELANRILQCSGSESTLSVMPSRDVEVVRFVADIAKAVSLLSLSNGGGSLSHLPELVCRCDCAGAEARSKA